MALKAYIANPLYTSVFKFLLEDTRIDEVLANAPSATTPPVP